MRLLPPVLLAFLMSPGAQGQGVPEGTLVYCQWGPTFLFQSTRPGSAIRCTATVEDLDLVGAKLNRGNCAGFDGKVEVKPEGHEWKLGFGESILLHYDCPLLLEAELYTSTGVSIIVDTMPSDTAK